MQHKAESKGSLIIVVSLLLAMLLRAMPLPDLLMLFKPDWVSLVLIYWVMALPNRVGVLCGWTVGLFVDVLDGSLFGINALAMALEAFLIQMIFHRLRLFPRWKQAINVAVVIGINKMVVVILSGLVLPIGIDYSYWFSLIGSLIFWPWVFILLRDIRRTYC